MVFYPEDPIALQHSDGLYVRGGGCTSGCGACCQDVIVEVVPPSPDLEVIRDWAKWLELHGLKLVRKPGIIVGEDHYYLVVPQKCEALDPDGQCDLINTPTRPKMCADFPQHPDILEGLPDCSYRFAKVKE